jgi:hypothetical protein
MGTADGTRPNVSPPDGGEADVLYIESEGTVLLHERSSDGRTQAFLH